VTALVRGGAARAAGFPHLAGCAVAEGDARDPAACERAARGAGTVINLVGVLREVGRDRFATLHVGVTRHLVAAARAAGAARFLYVSALGVRADSPTAYGRTKWQAEEAVRASGLEWIVLRPSIVFARDGEFYRILDRLTAAPIVPVLGPGTNRLAPVRADDLARIEAEALARPAAWNRAYDVAGPVAYEFRELLRRVARGRGRRVAWLVHVPVGLVRPVVSLLSRVRPLVRVAPITADELAMLGEDSVADPAPVEAAFGLTLRTIDGVLDGTEAA
jgi:NADH dehydrogenase